MKIDKLRQLKSLAQAKKSKIKFTRLSVNVHKSTRLVPTPLQTPLKITEFAQIRKICNYFAFTANYLFSFFLGEKAVSAALMREAPC